LCLPWPAQGADKTANVPPGYKLVYEQTFPRESALQDFVMTDPAAWRFARTNGVTALDLFQQSHYQPPVRSPVNIALITDKVFADFVLEADLLQTSQEYGHRDMCLSFGFQSPTNFYYVHLATAADDHAHNIFIVNGVPRTKIATKTTQGIDWGRGIWHKVRLERKVADGSIKVYFDDLARPIMLAQDKSFGAGAVGFGSFDDTGMVKNIHLWAQGMEVKKTEFFKAPGR